MATLTPKTVLDGLLQRPKGPTKTISSIELVVNGELIHRASSSSGTLHIRAHLQTLEDLERLLVDPDHLIYLVTRNRIEVPLREVPLLQAALHQASKTPRVAS